MSIPAARGWTRNLRASQALFQTTRQTQGRFFDNRGALLETKHTISTAPISIQDTFTEGGNINVEGN